jgi:hypothetical protein
LDPSSDNFARSSKKLARMKFGIKQTSNILRTTLFTFSTILLIFFGLRIMMVQRAISRCNEFHLHAEEQPFNIKTKLYIDKGLLLGIVTMDGTWSAEGPLPPEDSLPIPGAPALHHCSVIINAVTGRVNRVSARP